MSDDYYTYVEPGEDGETPVYVTKSTSEIILEFYPSWGAKMIYKYGESHFFRTYRIKDCIEDWCTIHWASKV